MLDPEKQQALTLPLLMALLKRLENIEQKLEKKISYLSTEDAVNEFHKQHLSRIKKPRNYYHLIRLFQEDFKQKNIAEITAEEIEQFLLKHWGSAHVNTIAQKLIELKSFFNWCIKFLKKKGQPLFYNPCDLVEFKKMITKEPDFYPIETIRNFINVATTNRQRLTFMVLATSGMRISELTACRKADIDSQVVTIRNPKSNRYNSPSKREEYAVIPRAALKLIQTLHHEKPFNSRNVVVKAMEKLKKNKIIPYNMTPHSLRKWVATYWHRKGDDDMVRFILRHKSDKTSSDPLHHIYIANLTPQEVCQRIKMLEKELGFLRK